MSKLTAWFHGAFAPAYAGIYEVFSNGHMSYFEQREGYSFWDGSMFNGVWPTIEKADEYSDWGAGLPVHKWRGLAKEPKP